MLNDNGKLPLTGASPSDDSDFWLEWGKTSVKEGVGRLEDAAKQIISITSILQAIYFAAISFSDLKKAFLSNDLAEWQIFVLVCLFISPVVAWLISLVFAVNVVVPLIHQNILNSPSRNKQTYDSSIKYRSNNLWWAHHALIAGFVPLIFAIFIYLMWLQVPIK